MDPITLGVLESLAASFIYGAVTRRSKDARKIVEKALEDTNAHFLGEIEIDMAELRRVIGEEPMSTKVDQTVSAGLFNSEWLANRLVKHGIPYFPSGDETLEQARKISDFLLHRIQIRMLENPETSSKVLFDFLAHSQEILKRIETPILETYRAVREVSTKIDKMPRILISRMAEVSRNERDNTLPAVKDRHLVDWANDWEPEMAMTGVTFKDELILDQLRRFSRVIVTFSLKPSRGWNDPRVESLAVLEKESRTAHSLPDSMWEPLRAREGNGRQKSNRHDHHGTTMSGAPWDRWPLCIPSYDSAVEWRLESYCFTRPWGKAKERVVRSFVRRCHAKQIECRIIRMDRQRGRRALLVQSADYDAFLAMEWAYYKGLETALGRSEFYKDPTSSTYKDSDYLQISEQLACDPKFRDLIPRWFRDRFEGRKIDAYEVRFMLKGLIEREAKSRTIFEADRKPFAALA